MAEATLAIDYDQIDSATQIRLLTIQPGTGDVEVVCTLGSADREGAKYNALSYEWGKASKDDPVITVNDLKVQIRRNLYDALRKLRQWCGAKSIPHHNFEYSLAYLNVPESPFDSDKIFAKNPAHEHRMARLLRSNKPALNNLRRWLWVSIDCGFECSEKQDFIYALLGVSSDYEIMKGAFKVDYSKSAREVFVQLLWPRNISTWENLKEDKTRWLDLAKKMNLSIDQDLEREISSRFSRHEDTTFIAESDILGRVRTLEVSTEIAKTD
ncbi:heterokaryon incompatibility 6 OR allele [Fusarium coicis]|nr:heterokaryon incompatibility 6 OR allele [Fusarium coicis]